MDPVGYSSGVSSMKAQIASTSLVSTFWLSTGSPDE